MTSTHNVIVHHLVHVIVESVCRKRGSLQEAPKIMTISHIHENVLNTQN